MDAGNGIGNAVGGDVGQEAQTAGVDTNHRDAFAAHTGSGAQESTIASYAYNCIGSKVIIPNDVVIRDVKP